MPEVPPLTWHDDTTARTGWRDAPPSSELTELLAAAREQCIEYVTDKPADEFIEPPAGISSSWRIAHLLQARALQNAKRAGASDTLGLDGQTIAVRPMDWQVKNLLRPKRRRPGIG